MSRGLVSGRNKRRVLTEYYRTLPNNNPRLNRFFKLPSLLRKMRWVQKLVAGMQYREEDGLVRVTYPTGHVLYCPNWHKTALDRTMKAYVYVTYMGQYFRFGKPPLGATVLDVGANLGLFALALQPLIGDSGHVFCCEPVPENCRCLARTMEANGITNVTVVPAAIGDQTGELSLGLSDCWGEHSAVLQQGGETIQVPMMTVDQLVQEHNVGKVDFIKADTEGMEAEVLHGATGTIRRDRPYLAFSAYHKPGDLEVLSGLIREIDPAYTIEWERELVWGELDISAHIP